MSDRRLRQLEREGRATDRDYWRWGNPVAIGVGLAVDIDPREVFNLTRQVNWLRVRPVAWRLVFPPDTDEAVWVRVLLQATSKRGKNRWASVGLHGGYPVQMTEVGAMAWLSVAHTQPIAAPAVVREGFSGIDPWNKGELLARAR